MTEPAVRLGTGKIDNLSNYIVVLCLGKIISLAQRRRVTAGDNYVALQGWVGVLLDIWSF